MEGKLVIQVVVIALVAVTVVLMRILRTRRSPLARLSGGQPPNPRWGWKRLVWDQFKVSLIARRRWPGSARPGWPAMKGLPPKCEEDDLLVDKALALVEQRVPILRLVLPDLRSVTLIDR